MIIEYKGERTNVMPARVMDLGDPGRAEDEGQLFVEFEREGTTCIRRAYTTKKPPAEGARPFFCKFGGEVVDLSTLEGVVFCEADGRRI